MSAKKRKWLNWGAVLFTLLYTVATVLFFPDSQITKLITSFFSEWGFLLLVTIGTFGAYAFGILAHEFGHALVAKLRKFEVLQVVVLGYALVAKYPYETVTPHSHLGYVSAVKRNPSKEDLYFIAIAGPIFSLLACLIGLFILFISLKDYPVYNLGIVIVAIVLVVSSGNALYWTITSREGIDNDRAGLERLKENPSEVINFYDQHARYVEFMRRRSRDCSEEDWKSIPKILTEARLIDLYCFWSRFDEGKVSQAESHLRSAFTLATNREKSTNLDAHIFDEMAMYASIYLGDQALADQALSLLGEETENVKNDPYGEISRNYVWGDREKALEDALARLKSKVPKLTQHKDRISLIEWYERIFPELKGKVSPE